MDVYVYCCSNSQQIRVIEFNLGLSMTLFLAIDSAHNLHIKSSTHCIKMAQQSFYRNIKTE